jgi:hypothetical protein
MATARATLVAVRVAGPGLTTAESLKLAAQAFTRDVARLSCCAA